MHWIGLKTQCMAGLCIGLDWNLKAWPACALDWIGISLHGQPVHLIGLTLNALPSGMHLHCNPCTCAAFPIPITHRVHPGSNASPMASVPAQPGCGQCVQPGGRWSRPAAPDGQTYGQEPLRGAERECWQLTSTQLDHQPASASLAHSSTHHPCAYRIGREARAGAGLGRPAPAH